MVYSTGVERRIPTTLFDAMTSSNQRGGNFRISPGFGSLASSSSRFTFSRKLTAIFWYVLTVFILHTKHLKQLTQNHICSRMNICFKHAVNPSNIAVTRKSVLKKI